MEVSVLGQPIGRGTGRTKKEAEQAAACEGLESVMVTQPAQPAEAVEQAAASGAEPQRAVEPQPKLEPESAPQEVGREG